MAILAALLFGYLMVLVPLYAVAAAFGEDRFAGQVAGTRTRLEWNAWCRSLNQLAERVPVSEPTWDRLRRMHSLVRVAGSNRRLRGEVAGCAIELSAVGRSKTGAGLKITMQLRDPLPPGTCVRCKEGHRLSAVRFNDVVLENTVMATSRDPRRLALRLDREPVRIALLEVVHAAPGSRVTSDAIELELPGPVGDPALWLERVVALENALRAA